jgi:ABC-type transporter Mla maintaining outer membrane lipid asymmetry permease subunit MlaE
LFAIALLFMAVGILVGVVIAYQGAVQLEKFDEWIES